MTGEWLEALQRRALWSFRRPEVGDQPALLGDDAEERRVDPKPRRLAIHRHDRRTERRRLLVAGAAEHVGRVVPAEARQVVQRVVTLAAVRRVAGADLDPIASRTAD
jgi:hypothetical protein